MSGFSPLRAAKASSAPEVQPSRALTANDAQPMVRRINALLDPGNETKLRGLLTRAFRESRGPEVVDSAIQELVNRK